MDPIGRRFADRYVVESRLGSGRGGEVFIARDAVSGERVALKFLSSPIQSGLDLERVGLRSLEHPHLVRNLDSGLNGDVPFAVSELLEGGPLNAVGLPLGAEVLDALATQMLEALAYLHAQGIVHGDVKTENILVATLNPPHFKLADFGLARRSVDIVAGTTRGSPAFMPPEVIRGEPSDERGDLYSLGVVLYECAFGELPFDNPDIRNVLKRHLTERPARLDVPLGANPRLLALLRRLLSKEPAERPADARAALALWKGDEAAIPRWVSAHLGVVVGREAELARLRQALSDPESAVVALEGPSGIGKTRLMREFELLAGLQGVAARWVNSKVVQTFTSTLSTSLTELAESRARSLLAAMPNAPWVLIADDVDQEPAWFQQVLAFASREVASGERRDRLICLLGGEGVRDLAHEALEVGGLPPPIAINLQPFGADEINTATVALLGARRVHPSLLALLETVTGGIPAELEAACRVLVERELLRLDTSGALIAAAGTNSKDIIEPKSVRVERALADCTTNERALLDHLALLRQPAPLEFLAQVDWFEAASLDSLLRAGLVRRFLDTGRLACAHESLRGAILRAAAPAELRLRHDAIAAALRSHPTFPEEDAEFHAVLGSDLARAREAFARLASRTNPAVDPDLQREACEALLELWPVDVDVAERRRHELLLLDLMLVIGDYDSLLEKASSAINGRLPDDDLLEYVSRAAEAHLARSQADLALSVLDLGSTGAAALPRIQALRTRTLDIQGRHAEALSASDGLLEALDPRDRMWTLVVTSKASSLRALGRVAEAATCLDNAIGIAETLHLERALASLLTSLGAVEFYRGQLEEAERSLTRAFSLFGSIGDRFGTVRVLNSLAALSGEAGRPQEALERLRTAMDLSRRLGQTETLTYIQANLAQVYLSTSRYRDALNIIEEGLTLSRRLAIATRVVLARISLASLYYAVGRPERARQALQEIEDSEADVLYVGQACVLRCEIGLAWNELESIPEHLEDARTIFQTILAEDEMAALHILDSRYCHSCGRLEEALHLARLASERATVLALNSLSVQADTWLAELLIEINPNESRAVAASCLERAERIGAREALWTLHRTLGQTALKGHDAVFAIENYSRAIDVLREIAADAPTEMVESLLSRPDRIRVFHELRQVRAGLTT